MKILVSFPLKLPPLVLLSLVACTALLQPALPITGMSGSSTATETSTASNIISTQVQTVTQGPSSTPTPVPSTTYINIDYQFEFVIPEGLTLAEGITDEIEGPLHFIHLTKEPYRITLQFKTVYEDVRIGPRGVVQGELVKRDAIPVLGREITGYSLIVEGKTKMVTYGVNAHEIRIFASLEDRLGPKSDYDYEDVDIPASIQGELRILLQSLTRNGSIRIPDSLAILADIPLILPMEKFYYSQIYDTDVANACGPASALMVLNYYGLGISMDTVIRDLQALPSSGAFDPGCYVNTVCTSPEALTMLFYNYGLLADSHEDWTLPEIFAVVSRGFPIIADILWDPSTSSLGHFVVIYGVDLAQETIFYHDPYRGRALTSSWDEFAILWEGRVDVGDPLKPDGHQFWGLVVRPYTQDRVPQP